MHVLLLLDQGHTHASCVIPVTHLNTGAGGHSPDDHGYGYDYDYAYGYGYGYIRQY